MADYIAYLHKDKGSDYGVSFPDFPGAITAGSTLEEAKTLAREVLALHIRGMVEDGLQIPEPTKLDDLVTDPAMVGAVAFLVPGIAPGKTVRFNVTAQENQLAAIDEEARTKGLTRSAYMVQASLRSSGSTLSQTATRTSVYRGKRASKQAKNRALESKRQHA